MADQKKYVITAKAGKHVAGHRNPGVGNTLMLTERQAKYEVSNGSLVLADADAKDEKPAPKKTAKSGKADD